MARGYRLPGGRGHSPLAPGLTGPHAVCLARWEWRALTRISSSQTWLTLPEATERCAAANTCFPAPTDAGAPRPCAGAAPQKPCAPSGEGAPVPRRLSILPPGESLSPGAIWNQHSVMLLEGSKPFPEGITDAVTKVRRLPRCRPLSAAGSRVTRT